MPLRATCFSPQGQRGGCGIKKRGGVAAPHSLNSFVSCGLPLLFGFENDDPKKFEETIATPPKRGVPTDPDSGAEWHASIPARRGSLSSVFIPAGRLGKDAPERGALYAEIIHLRGERDWGFKIVDTPFRPGAPIFTLSLLLSGWSSPPQTC